MGETGGMYRVLVGKPKGKRPLGRIIIRSEMKRYGLDQAGSGYGQVVGTCECGNEPSGSVQCREFPNYLKTG